MPARKRSSSKNNDSCLRRLCGWAITLAVLGVAGYGMWAWLGKPDVNEAKEAIQNIDFGDFGDVLKNFTNFEEGFDEDPYVGDNSTQAWGQKTPGQGGLVLELQNALDETWDREFAVATGDWDNGDPDSLTLPIKEVALDRTCTQVDGVMKVCNGNYGRTGWVGINEALLQGRQIVSSVAKMNEYYLLNADFAERRYTMCHELGHGFGLPHTDERFGNADMFNCLDYTNNPENNILPGQVNFDKLVGLYGVVEDNGTSNRRRRRQLSLRQSPRGVPQQPPQLPRSVQQAYGQARRQLHRRWRQQQTDRDLIMGVDDPSHSKQWTRVSPPHPQGGAYRYDLGQGYALHVSLLRPIPGKVYQTMDD